jgi:hypothetical protein
MPGGLNRLTNLPSIFAQFQPQPIQQAQQQPNFFGQHSNFIGGQLRNQIASGGMSPFLEQLQSQGLRNIGRQARGARESIEDAGAASGFRGAQANLFNDLFEQESGAVSNLLTGIGREGEAQKRQALQQLLGLTQFQGGQQLGGARLAEGTRQFDITTEEGRRQFNLQLAEAQRQFDESNEFGFGDILGGILGTGIGAFTGGIGGNFADDLFN